MGRLGLSSVVKAQAVRLMAEQGLSAREVGRRLGINRQGPCDWAKAAGLVMATGRRGGLRHVPDGDFVDVRGRLTFAARMVIQLRTRDGWSLTAIAAEVGVTVSAVSKEIGKFTALHPGRAYRAGPAQQRAVAARKRPKGAKLSHPPLRAWVLGRLRERWSPQQIARAARALFPADDTMQVSHETIYQALYVQGRGSLRQELAVAKALRSGRAARRPRSRLPDRRGGKSWIGQADRITARPAEVADRAVPGHWEGDLVIGAVPGASALITLVERHSRYLMTARLPDNHETRTVTDELARMMRELPATLRRTLTWDRGSEMAAHAAFTVATDVKVYFCDPHTPWMRGSNENTNGLIRDYYPKGTDFRAITDHDIAEMTRQLNTRPRETLNGRTPAETLNEHIALAMTT